MLAESNPGWGVLQSLITAIAGLGGVSVGAWLTARYQKKARRHERLGQQLRDFYSPMIGMRASIEATLTARDCITEKSRNDIMERSWAINDVEERRRMRKEEFRRLDESYERQFKEYILPLYQGMLKHFTEHMWLAESSTISQYRPLVEWVDSLSKLWEGSISPDVVRESFTYRKGRGPLCDLYDDLQANFDRLRRNLAENL